MHSIQRPTLPDDIKTEEFCRWEDLDQDGYPNTISFCKIDRQHKYTAQTLARSLRFLSRSSPTAKVHGQGRGAGRDRVAGHESYLGPGHSSRGGGGSFGGHATVRHRLRQVVPAKRTARWTCIALLEQELIVGQTCRRVLCSTGYQSKPGGQRAMQSGDSDHPKTR